MKLEMGNLSQDNNAPELTPQQERTQELEKNTANLSNIEQQLDKKIENHNIFAQYPEEVRGIVKNALMKECYSQFGKSPNITNLDSFYNTKLNEHTIRLEINGVHNIDINPIKTLENYKINADPTLNLDNLKDQITINALHKGAEQEELKFNSNKETLSEAVSKANNERLKFIDYRNEEIKNTSMWNKIRGNAPEPIPTIAEVSLGKEEILRFAHVSIREDKDFLKMVDNVVEHLNQSVDGNINTNFWDTLKVSMSKNITQPLNDNSLLTADISASHEIKPDQNTTKANGHINYDYKTDNVTGNAKLEGDATKVSNTDLDYTVKASGKITTDYTVGEYGNVDTELNASHEIKPDQNTTKTNGHINYDYKTDNVTGNAKLEGDATKVSNTDLDYTVKASGKITTDYTVGEHGNVDTELNASHEIKPDQNTTKANGHINYDYKTDNVTGNAKLEGDATKVSNTDLDYTIKASGKITTDYTVGEYGNVDTELNASHEIKPDQNTTKANGHINYDYKTDNVTGNAKLEGDATKVSNTDLDYTIKASGKITTDYTVGEYGNVDTELNASHVVKPSQNTTKANGHINYDYKTDNVTGNAKLEGDATKVSNTDLDYTVKASGKITTDYTVGEYGNVDTELNASHVVKPSQNTTKANGHINYDYKTDNVMGNAKIDGNITRVSNQNIDYKVGVSGSIKTANQIGRSGNLTTELSGSYEIRPNQNTTKLNSHINYEYISDNLTTNAYVKGETYKLSNQHIKYEAEIGGSVKIVNQIGRDGNLTTSISGQHKISDNSSNFNILPSITYQNNNWKTQLSGEYGNNLQSTTLNVNYKENSSTEFNLYFRYENQKNPFNNQWDRNKEIGVNLQIKF